MLYLNTSHVETLGLPWNETVTVIEEAVRTMHKGDTAQPIKPYLRYHDPKNRIIAMPAFVGGDTYMAGLKWIASFPMNLQRGIPRAHSVTILNDAATGIPVAVFNTALISGIRTASVSGLLLREFDKVRPLRDVTLGIVGFGPIGQLHLQMAVALLGDRLSKVILYDIAGIRTESIPDSVRSRTVIARSWEDAYRDADLFITCTVSAAGYIDRQPKPGSLLLNVSLRDFKPEILDYTRSIIVDEWEEVCRENTDIETMHHVRGLQKENTRSIIDVVCSNAMSTFPTGEAIMFNPMGMAMFDIATATYYYRRAVSQGVGTQLSD